MKTVIQTMGVILVLSILSGCGGNVQVPFGSGLVEATEIVVSAEATGRLESRFVDEGDHIDYKDTIAIIDTTVIALQLQKAFSLQQVAETQVDAAEVRIRQARAALTLAEKEFERLSRLITTGATNQQQFDQAETLLEQASLTLEAARVSRQTAEAEFRRIEAEIELLKQQLRDCFPLSPLSGTILTTFKDPGELVAPGTHLVKIAKLDTVWVKIYLPSRDLTRIKLGDTAQVDPEDGRTVPPAGTVSWIASEAEFTPKNVQTKEARADLVYAVKISIPNTDHVFKIGMPVAVTIQ